MTAPPPKLVEAIVRWAEHAQENPQALLAHIQNLRRANGMVEVDQQAALLADVLQGVHDVIKEACP